MVTVHGYRYRVEDAVRFGLYPPSDPEPVKVASKARKRPVTKARKAPANKSK